MEPVLAMTAETFRRSRSLGPSIARRKLLQGVLASSLSACVRPSGALPIPTPSSAVGDAHVHLFNGADLPVGGFFKNVLIPNRLAGWPEIALALIDIAVHVLQASSRTASDELDDLAAGLAVPTELSPAEFARRVAARGNSVARDAALAHAMRDPRRDVADSYAALGALVREEGRRRGLSSPHVMARPNERLIDTQALADIAENGAAVPTGRARATELHGMSAGEVWAIIAWAFRMTHSRSAHLREYLAGMSSPAARPTEIINLLVDYDRWLDDRPLAGSDHSDQVRFWTRYAGKIPNGVNIHTFAGFDPLKHAIQKHGGSTAYFDQIKGWALGSDPERRVAGFKLYPPMGFSVSQNEPLPPPGPDGRAADIARKLWEENHWDVSDLPAHLDDALTDLFDFSTAHDIPLLAHGRNSNEAYLGAGKRAHPRYWLARARSLPPGRGRAPLRACVAHFRKEFDADGVVRQILDLNLAGAANIHFDFAFEEEVLDAGQAAQLLDDIATICAHDPRRARYFMFGSDWIMLAQVPNANRYLQDFDTAIRQNGFWAPHRDDVLGGNLRRFLKLSPAVL